MGERLVKCIQISVETAGKDTDIDGRITLQEILGKLIAYIHFIVFWVPDTISRKKTLV
jgi:hypothetical protein